MVIFKINMEKHILFDCIRVLTFEDINNTEWIELLDLKLEEVYGKLQINYEQTFTTLTSITSLNFSKNITSEWKYVCLGFYIIKTLFPLIDKSEKLFLSVQETKDFKKFLKTMIYIGISTKLQPNLPFYSKTKFPENRDIFWNYNVLKCVTFGLTELLKIPVLRISIIPEAFKDILVALYQISYCPLKKPVTAIGNSDTSEIVTEEIYEKLLQEQQCFIKILNHLEKTVHPNIFVKNTMMIMHKNSPTWFRKHVSQTLTNFLRSENGVELVAVALFSDHENDTAHIWKILEIFSKLILSCKKFPDFKENICKQLIKLLNKQQEEKSFAEIIFPYCTKAFYKEDQELCKSIFIREIISPLLYFTYNTHKFTDEDITAKLNLTIRMLHAVFVQNAAEENVVPVDILQPVIYVIFRFYASTQESSFEALNNDLKDILIHYLEHQSNNYINIFDRFLFDLNCKEILSFRNDIVIQVDAENIKLCKSEHSVKYSSAASFEYLFKLIKLKPNLLVNLFSYLLNCITNENKYFRKDNDDLLDVEDYLSNEYFARKISVYKLLSELAEEKCVQNQLNENPTDIVQYVCKVLNKTIELGTHLLEDSDSDGYQSVFTILIILENLLSNSSTHDPKKYNTLLEPLVKIQSETKNKEMKDIIKSILNTLEGTVKSRSKPIDKESKTELDKAIDDICDALIPTRGHGLLTLTKLIAKRDKNTIERKQFVLNILQQNLTNEDSFIYLNAINGLASMADLFPDTILNILCEEYSDSSRKRTEDNSEVRMKLGEVLLRVSKGLGEMAPKHKPLLLNTFLLGTKDDDDLIRASSLSNLGEICRVLGYKLGTMFTEVLVCVHSIIATDKSPQARRAAVTVIRQLFIGLDQEIIAFFKEDILPVYRTLKHVYNNDKDDVMRLQAQLALEELNESMKSFVFPKPELNLEKKIVMLD